MRRSTLLVTLATALSAVAAGPAALDPAAEPSCFQVLGAETPATDDDVDACRQDVWFHEAGTKVDNLDHAQDEPTFASWDTTPPSSSVTDGAGSGVATTSVLHQQSDPFDARESFVAAGTFTGAIDNVVVELYMFRPGLTPAFNTGDPGSVGQSETHSVDAELIIDGFSVASLADVDATLEPAGNAVERVTFAFRNVMSILAQLPGDVTGEHTVEVRTHGTGIGSDAAIVVYDTTEVPSGLVFNAPADLLEQVD